MEGAVCIDYGTLVGRKISGILRSSNDCPVSDRVLGSHQPASSEGELVVGKAEGSIQRYGTLEISLGACQIPPVELLQPAKIGSERFQGASGGASKPDANLVRSSREVQELGRKCIEERPHVGCSAVVDPRHINPLAAGHIKHTRCQVQ